MNRSPWKRLAGAAVVCALAAGGCSENAPPAKGRSIAPATQPKSLGEAPREEPSVATVNGKPISREQLVKPLVETYGLNLLLNMVRLEIVNQELAKTGLVVLPADVAREREIILKGAFPDAKPSDYDDLLVQLLKQQGITLAQWEILLKTNAGLRKVAEPMCVGKITEDNIRQAFDLKYGAQVKIRDIKVSNVKEAAQVKKALADGEPFADVARRMSQDPRTAPAGGEWPPFSANSAVVSDLIKEQAFGLKVGEVSDALSTDGAVHIITVEKRIPPVVAKLDEPTRAYLNNALMEKLVQQYINVLRQQVDQQAKDPDVLQITEPALKQQFAVKVAEFEAAVKEQANARRLQLLRTPTTNPANTGVNTGANERPPATKSGAATLPAAPDPTKNK